MDDDQQHDPSQLFRIRLWSEALDDDRHEVRGKVQHVVSGEARHFREWTALHAFLLERLRPREKEPFQTNKSREETHGSPTRSDDHERKHRP